MLILLAVGAVFGIIFHVGTKEETSYEMNSAAFDVNSVNSVNSVNDVPKSNTLQWSCWLKEHQFYQVCQCCTFVFSFVFKVALSFSTHLNIILIFLLHF